MEDQQDHQSYCVYIHTNKINGKKYIGITCQNPERRWRKEGVGYKGDGYFYNAIQKYGWDKFNHEIIADRLSKEQACLMEQDLIKFWQTQNRDKGYNMSGGGENGGYIDGRSSDPNHIRELSRENSKKMRANLTPEEKAAINKKRNDKRKLKRLNETIEEKEARLAKDRAKAKEKRDKETAEEKEARLAKAKEIQRKHFQNESPEKRRARLAKGKEAARQRRQNESTEERESRLAKAREAQRIRRQKKKEERYEYNQDGPVDIRDDKETGN